MIDKLLLAFSAAYTAVNLSVAAATHIQVQLPEAEPPPDTVSIVMPAWHEETETVIESILSLKTQSVVEKYPEYFETILVGCEGIDVQALTPYFDKVLCAPFGKLTARHLGIQASWGNIIAAVDSDSVPSYSPVIVRSDSDRFIEVLTIEELWSRINTPVTLTAKGEEVKQVTGYSVYSGYKTGSRYTRIYQIIRHPYNGPLLRFNCMGGLFDVSPNHSLIGYFGRERILNAAYVSEGTRLSAPIFKPHVGDKDEFFYGNKEVAWLFGFFAAEGCASFFKSKDGKKVWDISISNTNKQLIDKAERIFTEFFNVHVGNSTKLPDGVYNIHIRDRRLYEFMSSRFYTVDRKKRVPKEILNAPREIQRSFLEGYFDGDGESKKHTTHRKTSYQRFATNSWILAQGILVLVSSALGKTFSVADRSDKPDIVSIVVNHKNKNESSELKPRGLIKSKKVIYYNGYLYDLVTSEGAFNCGVGQIRVHNTFYPKGWLNMMLKPFRNPSVVAATSRTSPPSLLDPLLHLPRNLYFTRKMLGRGSLFRREAYFRVGGFNLNINQADWRMVEAEEEYNFKRKLEKIGKVVFVDAPHYTVFRPSTPARIGLVKKHKPS